MINYAKYSIAYIKVNSIDHPQNFTEDVET